MMSTHAYQRIQLATLTLILSGLGGSGRLEGLGAAVAVGGGRVIERPIASVTSKSFFPFIWLLPTLLQTAPERVFS